MISNNKLLHTVGVARQCEAIAKAKGLPADIQKACFVMGFLHDIGYEYVTDDITHHPQQGYDMLNCYQKYEPFIKTAIKNHGRCLTDMTLFDEILNTADLTINYIGEEVSIIERLADIEHRHGIESNHYKHAMQQAEVLPIYKSEYTRPVTFYEKGD